MKFQQIYTDIKFNEEKYRGIWSQIVFVMCLIILRLCRCDGVAQFITSLLLASFFIFINYKKMFKESVCNKENRETNYEIMFFGGAMVINWLLIKNNLYQEVFYNFNLKFLMLFSIVCGFFSLKSKIDRRRFTINDELVDKIHLGSIANGLFYEPFFLYEKDRIYHQITFGVTGSAKTVGALYPQIKHDIRTGKFVVIIEPKGDAEFRDYVYSCCKKYNREFKYISIGNSGISSGYNPFGFGDANAVKDKIMSSTDWSEQFYKKVSDTALLKALRNIKVDNDGARSGYNGFNLNNILGLLPDIENLEGLRAFLESLKYSSFAELFDESAPTLYNFFSDNVVFFVSLDSLTYPEVSSSLGKIVLQDMSTLAGHIIANIPTNKRPPISLYIDEIATFFSDNFLSFLSQTRASNIIVNMAGQSPANFTIHGEGVLSTICDNTSTKVIMASGDPDSREYLARIVGTRKTRKITKQVDGNNKEETGRGSLRDGNEFILPPDEIANFQTGQAHVTVRTSSVNQRVELDTKFYDDVIVRDYSCDYQAYPVSGAIKATEINFSGVININKVNGGTKNGSNWKQ